MKDEEDSVSSGDEESLEYEHEEGSLGSMEEGASGSIRPDIAEQVALYLEEFGKSTSVPPSLVGGTTLRCVVCTLPYGSCLHTSEWLQEKSGDSSKNAPRSPGSPATHRLPKDTVDVAMDSINDVIMDAPQSIYSRQTRTAGTDYSVAESSMFNKSQQPLGLNSLKTVRWAHPDFQAADTISGKKMDISHPSSRGGHTTVRLAGKPVRGNTALIILFGGVTYTAGSTVLASSHSVNGADGDKNGARFNAFSTVLGIKDPAPTENLTPVSGDASNAVAVYHDEIFVLAVDSNSWHRPKVSGSVPAGRAGHCAVAIGPQLMWVHGGRKAGAAVCNDTYILNTADMSWEKVKIAEGGLPPPRAWASAVFVSCRRVLLFGGFDATRGMCMNDLWSYDIVTKVWAEQIVVGVPPTPRYGHCMLALEEGGSLVIVLGGCCVTAIKQVCRPDGWEDSELKLRIAADRVGRAYAQEDSEIHRTGKALLSNLRDQPPTHVSNNATDHETANSNGGGIKAWHDMSQRAARAVAVIAAAEVSTKHAEEALYDVISERSSALYWATVGAKHPYKHMDIHWLDVDQMMWVPVPPPQGSAPPCARMMFGAVLLGGGKQVVIWGGAHPNPSSPTPCESSVHVLDLRPSPQTTYASGVRWCNPIAQGTREESEESVRAALMRLKRAQKSLLHARGRAGMAGVARGRTVEVQEAEALARVSLWRLRCARAELLDTLPPPPPRTHVTLVALNNARALAFGGWTGVQTTPAGGGTHVNYQDTGSSALILDLEQPDETRRRQLEEWHHKLEKIRQEAEKKAMEHARRLARAARVQAAEDARNAAKERVLMHVEDNLSAIWELSIAPAPRMFAATVASLWLAWVPPMQTVRGESIPQVTGEEVASELKNNKERPEVEHPKDDEIKLVYRLFMRGGWKDWAVGDSVLVRPIPYVPKVKSVEVMSHASRIHSQHGGSSQYQPAPHSPRTIGSHSRAVGWSAFGNANSAKKTRHGTVTRVPPGGSGLFDVTYSDGTVEVCVPRWRLVAETPPPWEVVYVGSEPQYTVQGMAPALALDEETRREVAGGGTGLKVAAEFSLQVQGCEWPRDRWSQHSPVVGMTTRTSTSSNPSQRKRRVYEARALDTMLTTSMKNSVSGANRASSSVEKSIVSSDTAIKSKEGSVVEIEGRGVLPHDYI